MTLKLQIIPTTYVNLTKGEKKAAMWMEFKGPGRRDPRFDNGVLNTDTANV